MEELKSYAELQNYFNNEAFVLKTQQHVMNLTWVVKI